MIILKDIPLREMKMWCGAKALQRILTDEELDTIDEVLTEIYPKGLDETSINDLFWFDGDFIAETLGYESEEQLFNERR